MPDLIYLAVVFFVLAIVFWILGARGAAGISAEAAKWMVIAFIILAILVVIFGRL